MNPLAMAVAMGLLTAWNVASIFIRPEMAGLSGIAAAVSLAACLMSLWVWRETR